MKRQIRRGTFETNSSSTHAICIAKEGYNKEDYINFKNGTFEWEVNTYYDTYNKASYLITAIFSCSDKDYADKNLQKLKDILDNNNIEYTFPTPEIKSWEDNGEIKYYYDIDGYIDHCGETKEFVEAVLNDEDKLMRYLFGDSMIVTGNDNDNGFNDIMYIKEEEEVTRWGTCTKYGELKPEFDNYEIYEKWN
jgi:hypothetical protein